MWQVSALYRPCIGHRTGYSLHENARISGLASADFEGVFAHSYKRWRSRLFFTRAVARNQVDRRTAKRQVINNDRTAYTQQGLRPAGGEPWRGHVDESFFWGGSTGKRAW